MRSTNIKFMGLASGLDTESMVKAMVMPYQQKVDGGKQDQKLLELKKDAWKDMNTKIYNFYSKTLNASRLQGTFNQKNVSMSMPNVVEVKGNGNLPDGTHDIKVTELAKGAVVTTNSINKSKTDTIGVDGKISVTIEGKDKPVELELKSDMTVQQLENQMKEKLGGDLNINFDEQHGTFFISSKQTGNKQGVTFTSDNENVLKAVGISGTAQPDGTFMYKAEGRNAEIEYNGMKISSQTNQVTVNGMEIKVVAKGETTVVATRDTEAIVTFVKEFVDEYNKLIEEINKKVDAPYNKSYKPLTDEQKKDMTEEEIKLWNDKINDSILRGDSTLKDLTQVMRGVIGSTSVTDPSDPSKKLTLASFGIETGKNWKEKGKLYINEEKLRDAINKNPDAITELFTKRVETKDIFNDPTWQAENAVGGQSYEEYIANKDNLKKLEKAAMSQSGVGAQLYYEVSERLKSTNDKSANFLFNDKLLDKQIRTQKDQVSKLEDQMNRMENMYYKRFAAMEKMMSQLNNQSNWLAGQLGGM